MTKWHFETIGDLVREKIIAEPMDGNHGEAHPKGNDFTESGIPFVMASDIKNGEIDFGSCKYIAKDQADELRKGFSQPDDVLLSHKATIGRTAIVPKVEFPYLMLTPQVTYYRVLDSERLNNKFLKYYFDSPWFQKILNMRAGAGSTRAYIGIIAQKDLPIILPDINLQKRIVDVLSVIDKKITLNKQVNSELENMAKLIYDYWFVQFDFPNQNGKPYKSSGGQMFFNKDLKREIPKEWVSGKLDDLGTINGGSTPSSKEPSNFCSHGMPWLTPADMSENTDRKYITRGRRDVSEKGINSASLQIYPKGTVLLTSRAPVGYLAIARNQVTTNQGFKSFTPNNGYPEDYIFYVLKSCMKGIINYASGSTFKEISSSVLKTVPIAKPPTSKAIEFSERISAITALQNNCELENEELEELREWLLPLLINEQVTVSEEC